MGIVKDRLKELTRRTAEEEHPRLTGLHTHVQTFVLPACTHTHWVLACRDVMVPSQGPLETGLSFWWWSVPGLSGCMN